MKTKTKFLSGALLVLFAGQALAATTWSLTSASASTVSNGAYVFNSSGKTVTVSGWANTAGTDAKNPQNGGDTTKLEEQAAGTNLFKWDGGLGINNLDACGTGSSCDSNEGVQPEHAIDNNGRNEMVLLSFSQLTKLTSVNIGWVQTGSDADYTILAYTGSGTPKLGDKTWSSLGTDWMTIGSYANSSTGDKIVTPTTSAASNIYSSYWLVGAYNPLADKTTTASGLGAGNDYLKLASVSGELCVGGTGASCSKTTGSVPEPGSLALFGVALFGMLRLRRRPA